MPPCSVRFDPAEGAQAADARPSFPEKQPKFLDSPVEPFGDGPDNREECLGLLATAWSVTLL